MAFLFNNIDDANHNDYVLQLNQLIQSIDQLDLQSDAERRARIRNFMRALGNVFLEYFQTHLQVAQKQSELNRQILSKAVLFIHTDYVLSLEQFLQGTFEGYGEWQLACQQRTNIEAFNQMFCKVVDYLNTEEIDEYIQQRKQCEGIDQSKVPANIPRNHWWWYA